MSRPKVLLTNRIGREGVETLQPIADVVVAPDTRAETLLDCARDADAILVRANLPPNIFEVTTRLRGVVRYAVGLDMIPVEAASAISFSAACRAPRSEWRGQMATRGVLKRVSSGDRLCAVRKNRRLSMSSGVRPIAGLPAVCRVRDGLKASSSTES